MKKLTEEEKKRLAELMRSTGSYPRLTAERLLKKAEERCEKKRGRNGKNKG